MKRKLAEDVDTKKNEKSDLVNILCQYYLLTCSDMATYT